MPKQRCLLWNDCIRSHLLSEQKSPEHEDTLTEFWHAEMEMAWASNDEIMAHGEGVVRHIARTLLDEREDELTFLDAIWINSHAMQIQHILRMRYDEAIEILQSKDVDVNWGDDLDYSKEKILTQDFDVPHFLTHYPKIANRSITVLIPAMTNMFSVMTFLLQKVMEKSSVGEKGPGQKKKSCSELMKKALQENHINSTLMCGSYGGVPHGGFGLGVDRVVSWLAERLTYAKSYHSHVLLAVSHL